MSRPTREPVIQAPSTPPRSVTHFLRLAIAVCVSFAAHGILFALFLLAAPVGPANSQVELNDRPLSPGEAIAEAQESLPRELFDSVEVDPSGASRGGDIAGPLERSGEFSLPGEVDPRENIGRRDGDDSNPPVSYPAPPGLRDGGPGGTMIDGIGRSPEGAGGGSAAGNK